MMKVLLVSNLFPTPVEPERGIFTFQLARKLSKNCEITIICPLPWFPNWKLLSQLKKWYLFSQVPRHYQFEGLNVYSPKYPMLPKISESVQAKLMTRCLSKFIGKLHQKHHFDVINSHWLYPDSVAIEPISRSLHVPFVATGLGCDVNHDLFDRKKRAAILSMLNSTQALTVVSNDLKRVLLEEKIPEEKISTIPNGINSTQFKILAKDECRNHLSLAQNEKIILYVGRLSEEKNLVRMLKAFAQLKTATTVRLIIVGNGPLRKTLCSLAKQLDISKRLLFVGNVEHSEVSLWMGCCDFLCLPSIREGCPNVVLEALGCGRPVVASNVGAIPDLVSDNSGLLFNSTNIQQIKESFEKAIIKEWDSKAIAESVKYLTWQNSAKMYLDVYQKVIGRH